MSARRSDLMTGCFHSAKARPTAFRQGWNEGMRVKASTRQPRCGLMRVTLFLAGKPNRRVVFPLVGENDGSIRNGYIDRR
jgi:hypothetical protein